MEMPRATSPKETLTHGSGQCYAVGEIYLHFQCGGTTIDERILVIQP